MPASRPRRSPRPRIIARDIVWRCGPDACQGSDRGQPPAGALPVARQARRPARQASSSTAAPSAEAELAKCNASAKPGSRAGARRTRNNRPGPRGPHALPADRAGHFRTCNIDSALPPHRGVLRQYELVEKVRAYDPDADEGLINRAYVFSMKAHGAQVRASRRPLFQPSDRSRRHPHRFEARRRDDRHRDPPRHDRGHASPPPSRSRNCSAPTSRGWSTG